MKFIARFNYGGINNTWRIYQQLPNYTWISVKESEEFRMMYKDVVRIHGTYSVLELCKEAGDFTDEADSLEDFIERNIEKFL